MDADTKTVLLTLLRQEAKFSTTVLATREEAAYFGSCVLPLQPFVSAAPKIAPLPPPSLPVQEELKSIPPPPSPKLKSLPDIRLSIQKALPHMRLKSATTDDSLAKKMARLWEAPYLDAKIVLIAFNETNQGLEFLHNVAHAVDKLLAPTRLINGETYGEQWDLVLGSPLLHTLLISPWSSWKNSPLSRYYRQNGTTGTHFLGKRPLLFLEPASHYLTNPELKRKLWKELNMRLSS